MKVDLDANTEGVLALDVQQGETEGSVHEVSGALVQEIRLHVSLLSKYGLGVPCHCGCTTDEEMRFVVQYHVHSVRVE